MFSFLVEIFSVPAILRRTDLFIRSMMTSYRSVLHNFDDTLYIAGNHEPYGYNCGGTWNVLKEQMPVGIHLLENDYVKIKDWVFLGATLWTDFRNENALEMMEAQSV
jgi:hypothetical protein